MIDSVLEPITILTSNTSAVTFTNDDVKTRKANCCGWLQHNEGSPIYKILEGGIYKVNICTDLLKAASAYLKENAEQKLYDSLSVEVEDAIKDCLKQYYKALQTQTV